MARRKKPLKERRVPLAIYVPPAIMDRLREVAEQDRRSLSSEALLLLERALQAVAGR